MPHFRNQQTPAFVRSIGCRTPMSRDGSGFHHQWQLVDPRNDAFELQTDTSDIDERRCLQALDVFCNYPPNLR